MLLFPEVLVIHKGIDRNNGVFAVQRVSDYKLQSESDLALNQAFTKVSGGASSTARLLDQAHIFF